MHSSGISPLTAHYALAQEIAQVIPEKGAKVYQYIDDILIGGPDTGVVGQTQTEIITHLESLGLQIPAEKVQPPPSELKFLSIWWRGRTVCIPPETRTTLEQVRMPEKMELQHALGLF